MTQTAQYIIFISVLILLAACAANTPPTAEPSPIAQVAPSETPEPAATQTSTPEPTATSMPTWTPTPAPTATATPSPSSTPLACDILVLEEAIDSLNGLDSYRSVAELQEVEEDRFSRAILLEVEMAIVLENGRMTAVDSIMNIYSAQWSTVHMVFAENGIYIQDDPDSSWQLLEGDIGQAALQRLTESQYLKPELVANLEDADCTVANLMAGGYVYQYSNVAVNDIASLNGQSLADLGLEASDATLDIRLPLVNGRLLPMQFTMNFATFREGEKTEMYIIQTLHDINVPFEITIPENVHSPTFFLDIPLPDDAEISLEAEDLLVYLTATPKDEMLVFYQAYFEANGWQKTDTYEAEQQGILLTVTEYTRGELAAAFAVGDSDALTIISISAGDAP